MCQHRLTDIDLLKLSPQLLCHPAGIGIGPVRGSKAGHGHRVDLASWNPKHIKSSGRHQKCKGRIQPSGNADDRMGDTGMLQTLLQAAGLDGEDFLAPRLPVPSPLGDEGILSDGPGELCLLCAQGKGSAYPVGGLSVIGVHFPPLKRQPVYINLADGQPGLEAGFRQNRPVFRYDIVPGKDQVGGGLSLSGVGIDVAADQTPGLSRHQLTAVGGFASYLVGGGQIQNNSCAQSCQMGGWGRYSPKILAKLHSYRQIWHLFTHKQLAGIEVGILAAQRYR